MTDPRNWRRSPRADVRNARTFVALAGSELRRWIRQPLAVATAFVFPVGMAALVSAALGRDMPEFELTFAVVDLDHGPAGAAFIDEALGHPSVEPLVAVRQADTNREAGRLLDRGEADISIVLPAGLSEHLDDDEGADIDVGGSHPVGRDLADMLVDQYLIRARATAVAIARTGAPPTAPWPLEVSVMAPDGQRLDAARHYGPGTGMFFVLVTLGFAAQRFVADRRRGLSDRLAAAPVAPAVVLAGRVAGALVVGGLSMTVTALSMQLLLGRSWGPTTAVMGLIAAVVVALGGVAALVAAHCRTPEQAQLLAAGVAFVFALASGTFSPPGAIGTRPALAALVPTTHALDGFALLATEGTGMGGIAATLALLLGFGTVGFAAAGLSARRSL